MLYYCQSGLCTHALNTASSSGLHNFQRVNKIIESSERGHKDEQHDRPMLV